MTDHMESSVDSDTPEDTRTNRGLNAPSSERVASVDTVRGLTILLMIFVNDLGTAAPAWMHHIQPSDADGMTLADIVFPAFLFLVGISIPLAAERALATGRTRTQVLSHVLTRTIGLLIMGLIGLNRSGDETLGNPLWGLAGYVAIILAWSVIPSARGRRRNTFIALKSLGAAGLIILLIVYRSEPSATEVMFIGPVANWTWLRTGWWGILGLIGWAYLTASVVYLLLRTRREWLMGAMALLFVNYLALSDGGFFTRIADKVWLDPLQPLLRLLENAVSFVGHFVDLGSCTGSLAAIVVAGSLLGTTLSGPQNLNEHSSRIKWAAMFVLGLFVAGLVFDNFAGVNKIAATPTWCLWCAALTCAVWTIVYWVMDVRGVVRWSIIARPAGANPLIAYLLHPILISLISICGLSDELLSYQNAPEASGVILGSIAMALIVCALTGLIARAGLTVRI
jgi:heparan-alpha-glucosaminide N-acetyltransferase